MTPTRAALRASRRAAAVAILLLALAPAISWAVLVAPHAVFMTDHTRSGQIYLVNTSTEPEEVSVDLQFGYPDVDSTGVVFVRLFDHPPLDQPSAASWIRAYPRRLTLRPHERQVVRLLATPPAGLAEGEYWSRIIVTSRGGQIPVTTTDTLVRAGVSMELKTIISLTYRNGAVHTGVALNEWRATVTRDSLEIWTDLSREGTAAYLGTTLFTLRDSLNRVVQSWATPVAVYHRFNRRYVFPLDSVPAGTYRVECDVTTARDDIPASNVLAAAAIHRVTTVIISRP